MRKQDVIIESKNNKKIQVIEQTRKGIKGLWVQYEEDWKMKEKNITQKDFRNLVMQFMVEMREFKENQLEFNKNQLEFNKNQLEFNKNQLEFNKNIVSKNNLKE